jgi:hypothetical protein
MLGKVVQCSLVSLPWTSTVAPGGIVPEFGRTQYCLGAVVLTCEEVSSDIHRMLQFDRTLNASGVALELLSFNVSVTSLLKGPVDSMLGQLLSEETRRCTSEAELLRFQADRHVVCCD